VCSPSAFTPVHGIVGGAAAGLLVSVVVFPVSQLLVGRVVSLAVRRRVDRWIG